MKNYAETETNKYPPKKTSSHKKHQKHPTIHLIKEKNLSSVGFVQRLPKL